MRRPRASLALLSLFVTACGTHASPRARSVAGTKPVAAMLDDWHDAAAKSDEARYFAHLEEHAVFLGTDATERWDKAAFRRYSHPHFARGKAWSFRAIRRAIVFDTDDLAHFDEDLATAGLGPARGSGVAHRSADGSWRIVQYNLALTVPNPRFALAKEAASGARLLTTSKDDPLAELGFLSGAWVGDDASEEHWSEARAGVLLGMGRSGTFFEWMRIERRSDASVVLVAQPLGGAPTEFRRIPATGSQIVVFENLTHDWPTRITYQLEGQGLRVRVEGRSGERVEQQSLHPALVDRARAPR